MPNRTLKIAMRSQPHTEALRTGAVSLPGIALDFAEVKAHIAAFRMMVRDLAFDICDIAPTTYMVARAHGVPIIALPIFTVRRFHHEGIALHPASRITVPKDLEGKRFGVRAWSVTTGVWKRGLLQNDYGVDCDKVSWFVDDEEHVAALRLPDNVHQVAQGSSLAGMMAAGELDAACTGEAGIGRVGKPGESGSGAAHAPEGLRELFDDPARRDREVYELNGVYPIHGCIAVREELLRDDRGLAPALNEAFTAAKAPYLAALRAGTAEGSGVARDRGHMKIVGDDPLPYGLEANRPSVSALIRYGQQQRLIPADATPDDYFLPL